MIIRANLSSFFGQRRRLPFLSAIILVFLFGACKTTNGAVAVPAEETELWSGFVDADTVILRGTGLSPARLRQPKQKEATAKLAAEMDAESKLRGMCMGLWSYCCAENTANGDSELASMLRDMRKRRTIEKTTCKDSPGVPDSIECEVFRRYKSPGIRARCTPPVSGVAVCG